jgi:hypothetical protein
MTERGGEVTIQIALLELLLSDLRLQGRRVPVLLEIFDLLASHGVAWNATLRGLPEGGSSFERPDR